MRMMTDSRDFKLIIYWCRSTCVGCKATAPLDLPKCAAQGGIHPSAEADNPRIVPGIILWPAKKLSAFILRAPGGCIV